MFQVFKRTKKIGTKPPPKSKKPGLPLSYNDGVTICQEPSYPKPPRPGEKSILKSGHYKIIDVKYECYDELKKVGFNKMYLLKDMITGTTKWIEAFKLCEIIKDRNIKIIF